MKRNGSAQGPADADGAPSSNGKSFTMLVMEDEPIAAEFLQSLLEAWGHSCLRASSTLEALTLATRHLPHLIFLNRQMDLSDSMEFLQEIQTLHPDAAVILSSSRPSVPEAVEAMRLGAADYLERPLDAIRLKQAVDAQVRILQLL
jgi:DNA-binding NtrC family response regulator